MRTIWIFCLMLAQSAVSTAADPAVKGERSWLGMITMCHSDTIIQRDGKLYRAVPGAGILSRDQLRTGAEGPVCFKITEGPSVTLQSNGALAVGARQHLHLLSGETRIVHGGNFPLIVASDEVRVELERSVVRMQRSGQQTLSEVTTGVANLVHGDRRYALQAGQPISGSRSAVLAVSNASWTIDASQIRLASAVQAAPQLQLPAAPGATAPPPAGAPGSPAPIASATNSPSNAQLLAEQEAERRRRRQRTGTTGTRGGSGSPVASTRGTATPGFSGSTSLSLGNFSGATGAFSSGGLSSDANQQTFQGSLNTPGGTVPFPGQIHLVTAETKNVFSNVQLNSAEQAALAGNGYYSIGVGDRPTGQVITDANTASNPQPNAQNIAQFNAHIVKLDQYGPIDSALDPAGALTSNAGITGLIGSQPSGPTVIGTAPQVDERARINGNATFALGEFRVSVTPAGEFSVAARSSDQDRTIVKDPNNNDANDVVTVNPDVNFVDAVDPRFLPQSPTVKVPTALNNRDTNYSSLGFMRQAAFTTVVAESLKNYSLRTGQTRFVVDGRIVDISGYQP